jgi:hypothetical protein
MRVIYLPALEKRVSLKTYVAGIKLVKANPDKVFKHGLTCWWSCTGAEILKQFRDGVIERINDCIPYVDRGMGKDD